MMNADKQVMYSGVPQEDWQNKSKYPRIMSNGPKPPKTPEKSKRTSGLIPFMILTGITLLISAGVVIGLHYIKYTEQDGLVFGTGANDKASNASTPSGSATLVSKPIPVDNKNPAKSANPNIPQKPHDKPSDQGKESSLKVELLEKNANTQVNPTKPDNGKDHIPTTDDGNKKQDINTIINSNSEKIKNENPVETEKQQQTPEDKDKTDDVKNTPEGNTAVDGKQNPADIPAGNQDNPTKDVDDWFDIIKQDGEIIFQKPTTEKPHEIKETDSDGLPTKKEENDKKEEKEGDEKEEKEKGEKEEKEKDEKEEKEKDEKDEKGENDEKVEIVLNKKDKVIGSSKEKEEHEEDNKKEDKKEVKEVHEDNSLLYKTINNIAQKYFNSTNLNPSQVKDLLKNLTVGPSLEVIIIASGIIFIGLSLLIIAITCLVTRTRKIRIRREKIKKAVSDLEGAEKVILLTDEQSEDEYVKA